MLDAAFHRDGTERHVRKLGMMVTAAVLLLGLAAAPAGAAQRDLATEVKPAQALLAEQRWDEAYAAYLKVAEEKGNALAMFSLGMFHRAGWGRPRDDAQACAWFVRAAEGHIPTALHFAAECFEKGSHQTADPARAATLYAQAAEEGHTLSLCNLARLYMTGAGVPKDPAKAIGLCRQAAGKAIVPAYLMLADLYATGDASVRDARAAADWEENAAQSGNAEGQMRLARRLEAGDGRPVNLNQALFWYETAAGSGHAAAYLPTARLYAGAAPDPATGKPTAPVLAKTYLWASAARRAAPTAAERQQAGEILSHVLALMPETWKADLDSKVAQHFRNHPTPPDTD